MGWLRGDTGLNGVVEDELGWVEYGVKPIMRYFLLTLKAHRMMVDGRYFLGSMEVHMRMVEGIIVGMFVGMFLGE